MPLMDPAWFCSKTRMDKIVAIFTSNVYKKYISNINYKGCAYTLPHEGFAWETASSGIVIFMCS